MRLSVNNVILSSKYPIFGEKLKQLGYHVIPGEIVPNLIPYERDHVDMQCLILDNTAFVLKECRQLAESLEPYYHVILTENPIAGKYPSNVRLNAAVLGKTVIANTKHLDKAFTSYCNAHDYQLIHVNQGYAKCSCAIVSDNALITADNGIYNSLRESNIEVLRIRQGRVKLKGAEYGFIGGASGLDIKNNKRILYFSGCIERHPDYPEIKPFCDRYGTEIKSLSEEELIDIGGMIFC